MSRDQNHLHREIDEYMADRAEPPPPEDIDDDWDMYEWGDEIYEAGNLPELHEVRLRDVLDAASMYDDWIDECFRRLNVPADILAASVEGNTL